MRRVSDTFRGAAGQKMGFYMIQITPMPGGPGRQAQSCWDPPSAWPAQRVRNQRLSHSHDAAVLRSDAQGCKVGQVRTDLEAKGASIPAV